MTSSMAEQLERQAASKRDGTSSCWQNRSSLSRRAAASPPPATAWGSTHYTQAAGHKTAFYTCDRPVHLRDYA